MNSCVNNEKSFLGINVVKITRYNALSKIYKKGRNKMEENILNSCLENTARTVSNHRVIFLRVNQGDTQKIINDLNKQYQVTPIKIEDLEKYKNVPNGMNPIIISEGFDKTIENMKSLICREIIYIENTNSINKLINLIKDKSLDNKNEIKYEMLEKVAFESLFEDNNVDIKKFVLDRLDLLEKINCNFENIDIDFLITCLNNYYENKILFASFAQLVYRLANLDFISTTKRVGGNIREILGVKSSTISRTRLVDLKVNQLSKSIRVYNLNENTLVSDKKIRIAEELVKLNSKDLDITKISKITELPLKKVEKMYREALLG